MAKRKTTKARAVIAKIRENPAASLSLAKQGGAGVISFAVSAFVSHQSSRLAGRFLGKSRGNLVGLGTSVLALAVAWWATRDRLEDYRVAILSGLGASVVLRLVHIAMPTVVPVAAPVAQAGAQNWEPIHTVEPEDSLGDDDIDLDPNWKF